jgi:nicotinamide-nucleotide amidase
VRTEFILVGDELLEDQRGVQPAYLGTLVTDMVLDLEPLGAILGRLTVAGDGPGELGPILADAAARGVDLLVTVGGLGPTHDDRVREEVATALGGGPPEPHPEAMAWLTQAYERRNIPVPQRGGGWERMGHCPPGTEPLRNPEGLACGLAFRLGGSTEVRCLPGVTHEALPMWREVVLPDLQGRWGGSHERSEATVLVRGVREGVLAPVVDAFLTRFPSLRAGVYLMDLRDGRFGAIRVTLRGGPADVSRALPELEGLLGAIDGAEVARTDVGGGTADGPD